MIQLDGSYQEGGGQIIRTALALSTLLNKPFIVTNIRKNRPEPGLKNQHLYCIKALQQLCNAKVEGAELGSESVTYIPNKISSSKISINIETAGSITLLLQSLLLPCIFTEKTKKIEIIGGTDVRWSPQIDYFNQIIIPNIKKYAEKTDLKLEKRGYYPKGNGKILLKIKPKYILSNLKEAQKFDLINQGTLINIKGISHASDDLQKAEVAERQAREAKINLSYLKVPITITSQYTETYSTGSGITLWAVFSSEKDNLGYKDPIIIGSDELGEKGKSSEEVGKQAALKLLNEINSKAPVDQNLADNLIPFLALVKGKILVSKITPHTLTNIYTVEQFLGKTFKIEGNLIKTIN